MRDKCKGATCNRFNCPANCQNKKGKVWGTLFYDVVSLTLKSNISHYTFCMPECVSKDYFSIFLAIKYLSCCYALWHHQ